MHGEMVDELERKTIDAHMVLFRERYGAAVKVLRNPNDGDLFDVYVNGRLVKSFCPYLLAGSATSEAVTAIEDALLLG